MKRSGSRTDVLVLGGLSFILFAWFLWPFVAFDARFPLGPDAPVYLWWARLAGEDGLSVVGARPGIPALTLTLQGALGRSVVEATSALEIALGVSIGLAATALVRTRGRVAFLAGLLAGTFAVHLAAGYLANLAMAAAFLAAAVALADGTRRAAYLAAGILAAGGLAHPLFLVLAAVILVLAAAMTWRDDRLQAGRVAGATAGAGVLVGAGLLSVLIGPSSPDVDTSRDAFLRRAGLGGELRASYLDRFIRRWARYVQLASVPLAVAGLSDRADFVATFLRAWGAVLVGGVIVALPTGWLPADRFVTFGFVVPILAALGLVRVVRWFDQRRRRALGIVVAVALVGAMLGGAFIAWNRQRPFLSDAEVATATTANRLISGVEPGVPLVFLVDEQDGALSFLATRAGNVIRGAVPPDRIRDVVIWAPLGDRNGDVERRALADLTGRDVDTAVDRSGQEAELFVLTPFYDVDELGVPREATVIDPRSGPLIDGDPVQPLEPASRAATAASAALTLAFLWVVGYGWARTVFTNTLSAAATAVAIGAAGVTLSAIALERLGVPLDATAGAWTVSVLAGGSGYVLWRVLERRAIANSSPQVGEKPHE
ncbi:MAG TPA: hypothetical protein VFA08_06340 [Actinomycetota bacterium]|nr:hypothetical protein [Actinomycetota bacterium]